MKTHELENVKYVVMGEKTLGYIQKMPWMRIIAGHDRLGGRSLDNGTIAISSNIDALRPANEQDFGFFNVEVPCDFSKSTAPA